MITVKEGKRGPKDEGVHEFVYLDKELEKLEFLNLEFMVKECEQVFELFEFDQDTYPELYSTLHGASRVELYLQLNIKKNLKKTEKIALDEQHIEDIFSLNPQKFKDGEYDARIIKYFSMMIQMVQKEAIRQDAPLFKEKWLNIARHRAEKGHIWRDVRNALGMASKYAGMNKTTLDKSVCVEMANLHNKGIQDYANKNIETVTSYASRVLKQRTSEPRFKKLMHYAKKLSNESGTYIFTHD